MLCREYDGVVVDFSRQRATQDTLSNLFELAKVRVYVCHQLGYLV